MAMKVLTGGPSYAFQREQLYARMGAHPVMWGHYWASHADGSRVF